MPRNRTEQPKMQQWTKFDENNPLHIPVIKEFGAMMESKFPGGFCDDYCYHRNLIGKLPYRKEDGTYHGIREESTDGEYVPVRMPWKFCEEESMWQAWQRMKEKGTQAELPAVSANLPF